MTEKYISGLVSVVMPTYKRADKLDRAIESVLGQTYKNIELLVVNDNVPNDDFSLELIRNMKKYDKDLRFRLILQEKHINGAVARNAGIKEARGEYIAFLDDDDWWKPNKLEKQVQKLSSLSEEWGAVSCKIEQYEDNKIIAKLPKYRDGNVYKDVLMLKCDLATGTLMLRHEALDKVGYFDENLLRHQDYQLLVNFTYKYKLLQLDEYLHCCDVSDTMNRPSGEKLQAHKKKFFNSISPILNTLTKKEQRCVFAVHNFEVGYVFLKSASYGQGIKYLMKVFNSLQAVRIIADKILKKKQSSKI